MAAFSSILTSCRQHANSLLIRFSSNNSSNNTTSLPRNQQSLSVLAPAKPEAPVDISEHITEQVQPVAIAIVVALLSLLANQPTSLPNHVILYKIYLLFYLLTLVLSIVPLVITLITKPSRVVAWLEKQTIYIAIVSIVITVILRIFLLLPPPILWYDVLTPLLVVGAISVCLWYGWIKAKNSIQTSAAVTSSFTSEV